MTKINKSPKKKYKTLVKNPAPVVTPTWMLRNQDEFHEMLTRGPVVVGDRTKEQLVAMSLKDFVMTTFRIDPYKKTMKRFQTLLEGLDQNEKETRKKKVRK